MMSANKTKQNKNRKQLLIKMEQVAPLHSWWEYQIVQAARTQDTAPHKTKGQGGCHIISTLTSGYTAKE